jgi:hypothetical protein
MILATTTSEREGTEERDEEHDGMGQRCRCGGGKALEADVEGRPGGACDAAGSGRR